MRWSRAQRVALVVAYGAALLALWWWIDTSGLGPTGANEGWINVAPNQGVVFSESEPLLQQPSALRLVIPLLLLALWAVSSARFLRAPEDDAAGSDVPPTA